MSDATAAGAQDHSADSLPDGVPPGGAGDDLAAGATTGATALDAPDAEEATGAPGDDAAGAAGA